MKKDSPEELVLETLETGSGLEETETDEEGLKRVVR